MSPAPTKSREGTKGKTPRTRAPLRPPDPTRSHFILHRTPREEEALVPTPPEPPQPPSPTPDQRSKRTGSQRSTAGKPNPNLSKRKLLGKGMYTGHRSPVSPPSPTPDRPLETKGSRGDRCRDARRPAFALGSRRGKKGREEEIVTSTKPNRPVYVLLVDVGFLGWAREVLSWAVFFQWAS